MKTLFKIIAALVLVVILAVIGLMIFIDPNDYKPQIEQQAQQATGRALTIDGDIAYSLFPLGLELPHLELANAEGFTEPVFARIESLIVKVQLIPLLRKELQVDALSLNGLALFLQVKPDGSNNWQDIARDQTGQVDTAVTPEASDSATEQTDSAEAQTASPLAALAVNGIELTGAEIQLDDKQSAQLIRVSGLDLLTGKIEFGKAFDVKFKANVARRQSEQEMAANIDLGTALTIDKSLQQFTLDKLDIKLQAKAPAIHADPIDVTLLADADIDLAEQKVIVDNASIEAMTVKLKAAMTVEDWQRQLKVSGNIKSSDINLRELAYRFATELPPMKDKDALSQLEFSTDFELLGDQLNVKPLTLTLDKSELNGELSVALDTTAIQYQLSMDTIDVDDYLPPPVEQEGDSQSATASDSDTEAGSAAQPEAELPVPFEALSGLDVRGKLSIGQVQVAGYEIKDMHINTRAINGVIDLSPVQLQILDGDVESHTKVDTRQKNLHITQSMKVAQVHIAPIADPIVASMIPDQKVKMSGAGDIYADVTTQGLKISTLQKQLNGKAGFKFDNINADGLDIEYLARGVIADFLVTKKIPTKPEWRGSYRPKNQTAFDVINADFNIKQGVARTDNFTMDSSHIDVSGKGHVDIPAQTMDMRIVTDVTPHQVKTTAEKLLDEPLPVRAYGPWAAPQIDVDKKPVQKFLGRLLTQKAKAKVDKKVEQEKEAVKEKTKQKVEDKLKDKFKGLFR